MDVIGAGLGRTGTNTLQIALQELGFGPCYHMLELIRNPEHLPRWRRALDADGAGRPVDWADVFDGYRSTVDWPGCAFWRELAETHPHAPVVLTVRPEEAWYRSVRRTIFAPDDGPEDGPDGGPDPDALDPDTREFVEFMQRRMLPRMLADGRGGRLDELGHDDAVAAFRAHTAAVRAGVDPSRLLVYDVADGWEPLCAFLGVDVPATPFPHANDASSFRETFAEAFAERILRTSAGTAAGHHG